MTTSESFTSAMYVPLILPEWPDLHTFRLQVKDEIYVYNTKGERITRLASDFVGAATLSGRRSQSWFFATLVGFTTPGIVGRYNFKESEQTRWSIYHKTAVGGLNADDFHAEQVCLGPS